MFGTVSSKHNLLLVCEDAAALRSGVLYLTTRTQSSIRNQRISVLLPDAIFIDATGLQSTDSLLVIFHALAAA